MAMYEIANTGRHDMGRGIKATANIPAGTRILAETPLFMTNYAFLQQTPTGDREDNLARQLTAFPNKAKRDSFLALTNNNATFFDKDRDKWVDAIFTGVILTNVIPLQLSQDREQNNRLGVFAKLSRVNHGCRPNAQQTWNVDLQQETLHALHNISPGEEITISYKPTVKAEWLEEIFGFKCVCEYCLCEDNAANAAKSAVNCKRIEDLSCALGDAGTSRAELANCWERLLLIKQEYIVDYRAGMVYLDGFDIALEMKDKERAKIFAKLAEKKVGHCEGEDSSALRVMREGLAELCGDDDVEDAAEDDTDQRSDGGSAKWDIDGEEAEGHRVNSSNKDKGRAASEGSDSGDGYCGYESRFHWLFMIDMIEEAPQDDEEDESA